MTRNLKKIYEINSHESPACWGLCDYNLAVPQPKGAWGDTEPSAPQFLWVAGISHWNW